MTYLPEVIGAILGTAIALAVLRAVDRYRDRQDARRQVAHWDATVERTTGQVWNPVTRKYERPPGTLPWKPPPPRWWEYPVSDVVLVALCLYADWKIRREKGGRRG